MDTQPQPAAPTHADKPKSHELHSHELAGRAPKAKGRRRLVLPATGLVVFGLSGLIIISAYAGQAIDALRYHSRTVVVGGTISDGSCPNGINSYKLTDHNSNAVYQLPCASGLATGQVTKIYAKNNRSDVYQSRLDQAQNWFFQFVAGIILLGLGLYSGQPLLERKAWQRLGHRQPAVL